MCSATAEATAVPKNQVFYRNANYLGSNAVKFAPAATATLLAVAPFALHLFQPQGMLTQMVTLAATTGVVLNAPHIYNYVYNHSLTAKVCAQPFVQQLCKHPTVQQGTAIASSMISDASAYLFPQAIPDQSTRDEDDHQQLAERKHFAGETKKAPPKQDKAAAKSVLANQMDTLKRAFRAVPTATAAALAVNVVALRLFQPEGFITPFLTLTGASASFFSATKLYSQYHKHPVVQNLWTHPVVQQVSNHPVTQQGAALASGAIAKASSAAQCLKEAYGRLFSKTSTAEAKPIPSFPKFRDLCKDHGKLDYSKGTLTVTNQQLQEIYQKLPEFLQDLPSPDTEIEDESSLKPSKSDVSAHPTTQMRSRHTTKTETPVIPANRKKVSSRSLLPVVDTDSE